MLTNLFFRVIFCDWEWSQRHLQKSAYTLETHFKNVQVSVTSCKRPLMTEHHHKIQGFYEVLNGVFPFKNVQLMVTTCKTCVVTEHGLKLQGFKKAFKTRKHRFCAFCKTPSRIPNIGHFKNVQKWKVFQSLRKKLKMTLWDHKLSKI